MEFIEAIKEIPDDPFNSKNAQHLISFWYQGFLIEYYNDPGSILHIEQETPQTPTEPALAGPSASGCCVNAKSSSKGRSSLYNKHSTADTSYDRSKI